VKEVIMYIDMPRFIILMQAFIIAALNLEWFNPNTILGDIWFGIGVFTLYQFIMILVFYRPEPEQNNQQE